MPGGSLPRDNGNRVRTRVLQCVYRRGGARECAMSSVQRRSAAIRTAQAGCTTLAEPLIVLGDICAPCTS